MIKTHDVHKKTPDTTLDNLSRPSKKQKHSQHLKKHKNCSRVFHSESWLVAEESRKQIWIIFFLTEFILILGEQFLEARVAVGLIVLLFEGALIKLLETERADEMFGVKFPGHGGDATTTDWLVTSRTQGTTFGVIMELTVRLAFVFKETSTIEGLPAVLKERQTCQ